MISTGWFAFGLLAAFLGGVILGMWGDGANIYFAGGYRKGYRDGKLGVPPEYPEKNS